MNTHLLPVGEEVPLRAEEDSEVALTTYHPHRPEIPCELILGDRQAGWSVPRQASNRPPTIQQVQQGCESIHMHFWANSDSRCRSHNVRTERGSQSHFVPSECALYITTKGHKLCDITQTGCISMCTSSSWYALIYPRSATLLIQH